MALLGGDNSASARDLVGRVVEAVREFGGGVVKRASGAGQAFKRATSLSGLKLPGWLQPIAKSMGKIASKFAPRGRFAVKLSAWFYRQPFVRFISRSLLRRILFSNLIGFAILFVGFVYLSLDSSWVINAKREALKIQAQIISAAIAGGAEITTNEFMLDPETIPGKEATRVPFRDDGFAAMELSIQPQRVAPILNRLMEPIKTRARVYGRSGTLVVDSSTLLRKGQITTENTTPKTNKTRPRTKNFWTRLQHWLIDKEVQVYKEIGTANGIYYPEVRSALKGKPEAMLLLNTKGEQIVSMAVPIQRMGRVLGVLLLSTQPGEVDDILAKEREGLWPLALLALIASIVTSLLMARTVAGPMKRLSETAELVSTDINAHKDLPSYSERKDEVGQMAKAFRSMTAALFDRIEASEKFAADVAHELKNPLTAASSTAQALEYAKTPEQRDELVAQIQNELRRLNRLITDVSKASRLNAELARQAGEPVAVDEVLRKVVTIFDDKAKSRGFKLVLDLPTGQADSAFVVSGREGRIAQVFTNLVDNALSFSPDNGQVKITARRVKGFVVVSIDDDGPGIEDDKLKTIFTRFYTFRPDEFSSRTDNSGLGLSISAEIIRAYSGEIWAENRDVTDDDDRSKRLGARFVVRLPVRRKVTGRGSITGRDGTSELGEHNGQGGK